MEASPISVVRVSRRRAPEGGQESIDGGGSDDSVLGGLLDWLSTGAAVAEARLLTLYESADADFQTELIDAVAERASADCPYALSVLLSIVDDFHLSAVAIASAGVERANREDVEQSVLIAVARSIHRFRSESKFTTWLYSVARNVAVSETRRLRPTLALPSAGVDTGFDTADQSVGSARWWPRRMSSLVAERQLIESAVAQLPVAFRETVFLRDVERLSYSEIAARQDVSINTVKSRLSRGRHLLTEIWDASNGRPGMRPLGGTDD